MGPTVDGGFQLKNNEVTDQVAWEPNRTHRGKEANVIAVIEKMLPEFARACRAHDPAFVIFDQDAFADYQEGQYRLMGLALKFAGICGQEVRIIGANRQTVDESKTTQ